MVNSSTNRISDDLTEISLIFRVYTPAQDGIYTCRATNIVDTTVGEVTVTVHGKYIYVEIDSHRELEIK